MSGEKRRYVSIEEGQLRRLREQESRLRAVQQDLPERLNEVRERSRQEVLARLAPLELRAQRQEQLSRRLKSSLADLEQHTTRRLQQQQQAFEAQLSEAHARQQQALQREKTQLETAMRVGFEQQRREYVRIAAQQRQEYAQLVATQERKFTGLLQEERQARERAQKLLSQQMDELFQSVRADKQRQRKLAAELLQEVEEIWSEVDRNYQHQRFAPGRLGDLRRGLEMANRNLEAGVSQAAIATTQQTYLDLVDLRLELEQKEQEWLLLYHAALQDIRSLMAEVQANRECVVEVGEGADVECFRLVVDYWVEGALTKYEQELGEIETELIGTEASLTRDRLQELGDKIERLQPRLGEIVEQAKLAILSSQLRAEIADRVVEILESLGYTLVNPSGDTLYEGDDQRRAYVVKVSNIAGDEVVSVISPQPEFGVNSISINSFSPTLIDETATQENARAIFQLLEQEGVKPTGQLECYEQARSEYRDLQQVKQSERVDAIADSETVSPTKTVREIPSQTTTE